MGHYGPVSQSQSPAAEMRVLDNGDGQIEDLGKTLAIGPALVIAAINRRSKL